MSTASTGWPSLVRKSVLIVPSLDVLLGLGGERRERHVARERLAKGTRDVRHRVVSLGAAGRPLPDLPGPVRRLAELRYPPLEEREIHGERYRRPPRFHPRRAWEGRATCSPVCRSTSSRRGVRPRRARRSRRPSSASVDLEGFVDGYFLVERDGVQGVTLTFWESLDTMERSRVTACAGTKRGRRGGGRERDLHPRVRGRGSTPARRDRVRPARRRTTA